MAPPGPVTIALAAPAGDADVANGARLAVDVVNEAHPDLPVPLATELGLPGLGGAPLRLTVVDTSSSAALAKVPGTLTAQRAVGVVCAGSAATVASVSAQTEWLGLPLLDAVNSADTLTDLGQEWYFRTAPSDRMLVDAAFALLRHQQLARTPEVKLAVLHDGRADGLLALVRQLAGAAGYPTVAEVDIRTASAQSIAASVDAEANVLVAVAGTKDGATAATKVAARTRESVPVLGIGPAFAGLTGGASDGSPVLLRAVGWSAEYVTRNPVASAVASLYRKRFGSAMTAAAAETFTATLTLAVALSGAGDADPTAIRATLRQMWLPATQVMLPWNGVRFDATGQNMLAGGVVEARTQAGFRIVYPRELATVAVPW
ncbi:ABC transporter substrate-binding protein [Luedemannella flava]|uniref:ABC transporter substrate-binding protein n=1 Tax=Luedemannella flava TaxID=349316 RepID=A0ABN2MB90_9ACTN